MLVWWAVHLVYTLLVRLVFASHRRPSSTVVRTGLSLTYQSRLIRHQPSGSRWAGGCLPFPVFQSSYLTYLLAFRPAACCYVVLLPDDWSVCLGWQHCSFTRLPACVSAEFWSVYPVLQLGPNTTVSPDWFWMVFNKWLVCFKVYFYALHLFLEFDTFSTIKVTQMRKSVFIWSL